MDKGLLTTLECLHGVDIAFDVSTGVRGTKDVKFTENDFVYSSGPVALAEELQRLFDLTPRGSLIDDPSYGIDWEWIGKQADPDIACAMTRLAVIRALSHPDFRSRFRIHRVDCEWRQEDPNVLRVKGMLEVYGFESIGMFEFGPYALQWLLFGEAKNYG